MMKALMAQLLLLIFDILVLQDGRHPPSGDPRLFGDPPLSCRVLAPHTGELTWHRPLNLFIPFGPVSGALDHGAPTHNLAMLITQRLRRPVT